jgi:GTP 3',8-cyclase
MEVIAKMKSLRQEKISIRLKVTEKCPWDCIFCHQEGGWGIEDIQWSDSTRRQMALLKEMSGATEIHYTGGEPTSHKNLDALTAGLFSLGLTVKTTTNGQFSERKLVRLMNSGLRSFNFSVHALNPGKFVKSQRKKDLRWAMNCIEHQKRIIKKAMEFGAEVKINTVVSSRADINRALEVFHFAKTHGIMLRFLNDLGNGREAIETIEEMASERLGARYLREKIVTGSSSVTDYYRDREGFEFGVKGIRKFKLVSLCKGCRENCPEQFYGIRMEQKKGKFFIRLCLGRHDEKSVMPLEDFLVSEQLREIREPLESRLSEAA